MRLYPDRPDIETAGSWHFCPAGAVPLPFAHRFASQVWDSWDILGDPAIGEVRGLGSYSKGKPNPRINGQHFCGSAEVYQNGALFSSNPQLPAQVDGTPFCCSPAAPAATGILVGGAGLVVRLASGGIAAGGAGLWPMVASGGVKVGGQGFEVPYLLDHFVDTDGTRLNAHTMNVGPGWTEQFGIWEIFSNAATLVTDGGEDSDDQAISDAGHADGHGLWTIHTAATGHIDLGATFNLSDHAHYWAVEVRNDGGANQFVLLYKRNGATFTVAASVPFVAANNTVLILEVTTLGDNVKVRVNAALLIDYTESSRFNASVTNWGLYLVGFPGRDNGSSFEEFRVIP